MIFFSKNAAVSGYIVELAIKGIFDKSCRLAMICRISKFSITFSNSQWKSGIIPLSSIIDKDEPQEIITARSARAFIVDMFWSIEGPEPIIKAGRLVTGLLPEKTKHL